MRGQQLRARLAAESAAVPVPHPRFAPADADRFALVQRPARSGADAAVPKETRAHANKAAIRPGRDPDDPPELAPARRLAAMFLAESAILAAEGGVASRIPAAKAPASTQEGKGRPSLPRTVFGTPRAMPCTPQDGVARQKDGCQTITEFAAMQIIPERTLTAPQAIRAFRMQSQQDAARLQAAGGAQDFAATLQTVQQRPANMAGPGTPTGNTLAALLQRLDTDQDGRITPLELRAATDRQKPPEPAAR